MFTVVLQHSYFCKIGIVEVGVCCVVMSVRYVKPLGKNSLLTTVIGFYHK